MEIRLKRLLIPDLKFKIFLLFTFSDCRYQRGPWSDCDTILQLKKRTDSLKAAVLKGQKSLCPETRIVTKKCNGDSRKGKVS